MNGTLPIFATKPIQKGDDLVEGSTVFRPILTVPTMGGVYTVGRFRFGAFIQSGTVGSYRTSHGTPFVTFGGTLSDPTASPHFRTEVEAEAFLVEEIQKAREELQEQIGEIMDKSKQRQEASSNCCRTKGKEACCDR